MDNKVAEEIQKEKWVNRTQRGTVVREGEEGMEGQEGQEGGQMRGGIRWPGEIYGLWMLGQE